MPDETKPATTSSTTGAAGDKGVGQRKIGGKFNTMEEAVESLVSSGDRNYHETREELSAMKQLLERALTPIGDRGRDDDQGYNRGKRIDPDEDEIDPTEFLSTPGKVLKRREARLVEQISNNVSRQNAAMINNAATVLRFQSQNPDLDEHENLVQGFLRETNSNDNLAKRLKEAGKRTRAYLAKIKGTKDDDDGDDDAGRSPNKDEYVEAAAGAGRGKGQAGDEGEDKTPTGDDDLAAAVAEHKAFRSSRFAPPKK